MPSENMTNLSDEYRKQLDCFIETNYPKLRKYAYHFIKSDKDRAEELLHVVIGELYIGNRTLNFDKSPLTYFQLLLRSIYRHHEGRFQRMFEKNAMLRDDDDLDRFYVTQPVIDNELYKQDVYRVYNAWKETQTKYKQWLLTELERGTSIQDMHRMRCQTHPIGLMGFRVLVTRLLKRVEQVMQAQTQGEP